MEQYYFNLTLRNAMMILFFDFIFDLVMKLSFSIFYMVVIIQDFKCLMIDLRSYEKLF